MTFGTYAVNSLQDLEIPELLRKQELFMRETLLCKNDTSVSENMSHSVMFDSHFGSFLQDSLSVFSIL